MDDWFLYMAIGVNLQHVRTHKRTYERTRSSTYTQTCILYLEHLCYISIMQVAFTGILAGLCMALIHSNAASCFQKVRLARIPPGEMNEPHRKSNNHWQIKKLNIIKVIFSLIQPSKQLISVRHKLFLVFQLSRFLSHTHLYQEIAVGADDIAKEVQDGQGGRGQVVIAPQRFS